MIDVNNIYELLSPFILPDLIDIAFMHHSIEISRWQRHKLLLRDDTVLIAILRKQVADQESKNCDLKSSSYDQAAS